MVFNVDENEITIPSDITLANEVTYLGVQIPSTPSSIAKVNYSAILKKTESDINRWMPLQSSLPARILVIKMNVFRSFIWNKRLPRIKWSTLQLSKIKGGWALSYLKLYH